jgi:hypothetical protein
MSRSAVIWIPKFMYFFFQQQPWYGGEAQIQTLLRGGGTHVDTVQAVDEIHRARQQ